MLSVGVQHQNPYFWVQFPDKFPDNPLREVRFFRVAHTGKETDLDHYNFLGTAVCGDDVSDSLVIHLFEPGQCPKTVETITLYYGPTGVSTITRCSLRFGHAEPCDFGSGDK